ncbi:MAG: hypothetical protein IKP88_00720 [Lachnospiraceae bacterium]|nr:hypothetical protein [Lachnospiraceae bacterium]
MYQMYAYSKKYGNADVWLLYPVTDEMRGHTKIEYHSRDNTSVRIFFVDVNNDNLEELKKAIEEG